MTECWVSEASPSLIDLETNIEQRYEGAPSKDDFDALLEPYGFKAVFGYRVREAGVRSCIDT